MDQSKLFIDILRLNETAAAAGHFEVAYHLLSAALHVAEIASDRAQIETVIALAVTQETAVDADPNHPMASRNARGRGNTPLYQSLVLTARGRLAQIEVQRVLDSHRSASEGRR